jgi:hypothetical protein
VDRVIGRRGKLDSEMMLNLLLTVYSSESAGYMTSKGEADKSAARAAAHLVLPRRILLPIPLHQPHH